MVRCNNGHSLWCSVFFYQFASGLGERYPELFEGDGTSTQHQINFAKKWKNYTAVFELAGGDIQKMDTVTELPLEQCLLFLAYRADKALLESMMHREMIKSRG
jgi:hypothetical protein